MGTDSIVRSANGKPDHWEEGGAVRPGDDVFRFRAVSWVRARNAAQGNRLAGRAPTLRNGELIQQQELSNCNLVQMGFLRGGEELTLSEVPTPAGALAGLPPTGRMILRPSSPCKSLFGRLDDRRDRSWRPFASVPPSTEAGRSAKYRTCGYTQCGTLGEPAHRY